MIEGDQVIGKIKQIELDCRDTAALTCYAFSCSPSYSISEGVPPGVHVGSYGSTPQPIPRFQHPSHELLQENGFTQQLYHKYHSKCLKGISK